MRMPRPLGALVAALVMVGSTGAAHAATSYTPDGGPELNLVGADIALIFLRSDQALVCDRLNFSGEIVDSGVNRSFGQRAAELAGLATDNCRIPWASSAQLSLTEAGGLTVEASLGGSSWNVEFTDLVVSVEVAACHFSVAGGWRGILDSATQEFTPAESYFVVADTPTGLTCPLFGISQGEDVLVEGSWVNVPSAGSTSLTLTTP